MLPVFIIIGAIILLCDVPKFYYMITHEEYNILPFIPLEKSKSSKMWLITHLITSITLLNLLAFSYIFELYNNKIYSIILVSNGYVFIIQIISNLTNLGSLSEFKAGLINSAICIILFGCFTFLSTCLIFRSESYTSNLLLFIFLFISIVPVSTCLMTVHHIINNRMNNGRWSRTL